MQIILLSGGAGTRLWPLSNDARSKQFLRILEIEGTDKLESMVQRVYRQLKESDISADITVATSNSQKDSVLSQLGTNVDIVTEPCRRDTFPAISLACEYLAKEKGCQADEIVIVMPCDPYTEQGYFECIKDMAQELTQTDFEMILMGITPTYPSSKYGYVVPLPSTKPPKSITVKKFVEKPSVEYAHELINDGALWNGGVFAFRLGFLNSISRKYNNGTSFNEIHDQYDRYPKISFDYEVAEKTENIGMIKYEGKWKDLGTWNTLTDELPRRAYGNVVTDDTVFNTHIFNELNIPLLCLGTQNLVIAASPDGIIVTEKSKSENIKAYASYLKHRPMYEERRWGFYRVIDNIEFPDGHCALTKQLTLIPGKSISYQKHTYRDEVWTFIDGQGIVILDGKRQMIKRGDVITIPKGLKHALKAITPLTFIEVQSGTKLTEEDIERFTYNWD